ncbi:hypothetical protein DITRI_Ditri04bG0190000 [Diplodiscus trichospermus]
MCSPGAPHIASIVPSTAKNSATSLVQCTSHMCPVRIRCHVKLNYKEYWRVKITITNFNYNMNYSQWNLVVQHPNFDNLTQIFSFMYKPLTPYTSINDTVMLWGIKFYNDLLSQAGPLGNVQSELLFRKDKATSTFEKGWAFPRRIYFNGDNCVMPPPDAYPWISLWALVLLGKYGLDVTVVTETFNICDGSHLWRALGGIWQQTCKEIKWALGGGCRTTEASPLIYVANGEVDDLEGKVCDYVNTDGTWRCMGLFCSLIAPPISLKVAPTVPPRAENNKDEVYRSFSISGQFSVNSAYAKLCKVKFGMKQIQNGRLRLERPSTHSILYLVNNPRESVDQRGIAWEIYFGQLKHLWQMQQGARKCSTCTQTVFAKQT